MRWVVWKSDSGQYANVKKESAGREAIAVLKEEKTWVTFVDNPAGNRYDQIEKVIYWCLYGAPVSPNGTVSSPVVAFYHEMGHGLQKKRGHINNRWNNWEAK